MTTNTPTLKKTTDQLETLLIRLEGLSASGNTDQAIEQLCDFLKKQPHSKFAYKGWFFLGVLLAKRGQINRAINAYSAALEQRPDLYEARVNLGLLYERNKKYSEAISIWEAGLPPIEPQTILLNHQGRLLEQQFFYQEAEQKLHLSLVINPNQQDVIQHLTHLRAKQCEWPIIQKMPKLDITDQEAALGPLGVLAYKDDPALQLNTIRNWVSRKLTNEFKRMSPINGYTHKKIRLGYMSSDFRWHAVSILAVELFELHNRNDFEIYALDFSPNDNSLFRKRVLDAFDIHLPLHELSDESAAALIRKNEIDILIDLNGLTANARPGILKHKPAPVQMTWLGSLTTTGIQEVDYIIADEFVLPRKNEKYFVEKPIYMPTTFQLNDSKRQISSALTREEYGLPKNKFIYACLNNNYKITPEVFAIWMRILKRVPESIIWLLEDNQWSKANLQKEAIKYGVAEDRVFFGQRIPPNEYLARFKVADLFLDTSPYNAGTTAIDAIWSGLPLITCPGKCFSSRVAGSILRAANLSELVVENWKSYEDLAVDLAYDKNKLNQLKIKLETDICKKSNLFNTEKQVESLENMLKKIALHAD